MPDDSQEWRKARRFLKERLQRDYTTLRGYQEERSNVRQLLQRTAEMGESNSLLLIGPRGAGKTTLINAVLTDLLVNKSFVDNTLIVHLDGNLHTDDRIALKSITVQMRLENAADGKVFGSFAENLAFLLQCLKAGDKKSKSVVFVLEEFDLFCTHHNQTLLYNLFDVSQSAQAPICVLGVTCRLDVIELLEKRVKSRFSHRQVFLFPSADHFEEYTKLCQELLSIPSNRELKASADRIDSLELLTSDSLNFHRNHFDGVEYEFDSKFVESWNKHHAKMLTSSQAQKSLQMLYDFDISEAFLKNFLFRLVAQLKPDVPHITVDQLTALAAQYEGDDKIDLLCGLSVLELCLIIAIKHHSEIYDRDPFNFEIVFARFSKFAKVSTTMQSVERSIVLKAFEHLRIGELIMPLTNSGTGKVQKEFEMHKMALTYGQIQQAVQRYQALPTEVAQWAQSSLI
ncbi:origin recognition complex subunit 4 [Drosophila guanche]|uniref:Origin recognition complex subunit 4 n=1 Tax=Drosophila guanche TaxID=7266 RepID=A0A3B0J4P4_DROGU|nr:origin recognition complex subunit 4 [Drosophila guanche]SPP74513.1 blast:Origin recognition complex subunit 4 [Drosophila guanche]